MFRFTIRELVLLTIIVALGAGWWTQSLMREKTHAQANRDVRNSVDKLRDRLKLAEITANNSHNEAQYWRMIAEGNNAKVTTHKTESPATSE